MPKDLSNLARIPPSADGGQALENEPKIPLVIMHRS